MNGKRWTLALSLLMVLALVLTSCGKESAPAEEPAPQVPDTEEPAAPAEVPTDEPPPAVAESPLPTATQAPPAEEPAASASEPTEAAAQPVSPLPTATEMAAPTAEAPPPAEAEAIEPTPEPSMVIASSAFEPGGIVPEIHSCFGGNVSPALNWANVPAAAESLVLIVDDPDSKPPGFVHWVVYNMLPSSIGLPQDVPGEGVLANGGLQGENDFAPYGEGTFPGGAAIKLVGYDGPCPGGEHRYVFALHALDVRLDLPAGATLAEIRELMAGHTIARAELTGFFAPP